MITDIIDLEQLLTQYASEAVLIGPLLSLSINTSYRYVYLAGNGRKVYQSVGLGFLENESEAQKQRADIIEKLRSRFAELVLFDSHAEMARAVHTRWPTEETARILAEAEREAKAAFAQQADYETIDERGDERTLRDEQSGPLARELLEHRQSSPLVSQASPTGNASVSEKQEPIKFDQGAPLAAEPATASGRTKVAGQESPKSDSCRKGFTSDDQFRELARTLFDGGSDKPNQADGPALADMMAKPQGSDGLTSNHESTKTAGRNDEHAGHDQASSIRLPPAATLPPLAKESAAAPTRQKHRDFGLIQDDIASAILKLASPTQLDNCAVPPVEPSQTLMESPTILAEPTASRPESIPPLPVKHIRVRATLLRLAAAAAAIVLLWTFVPPGTGQDVDKANNALRAEIAIPSESAVAIPLPVGQPADPTRPAQETKAALRAVPPPPAEAPSQEDANAAVSASAAAVPLPVGQPADPAEPTRAVPRPPAAAAQQEGANTAISRSATAIPLPVGQPADPTGPAQGTKTALKAVPLQPAAAPSQEAANTAISGSAAAIPLPVGQPADPTGPAQGTKTALKAIPRPPAAAPSKVGKDADAPSISDRHEPGAQQATTAELSGANEIAKLVNRGMESLKSGDLESARLSLQRAVEAMPGPAAVPSQVDRSQSLPLRDTSQALAAKRPGPQQSEHSPAIDSSSDARQSVEVASLEPGVAPVIAQKAPAQEGSSVRHLEPDEIAILLSRGMDFLKSGDFASARVTLRRAAEAGNAEAALALGSTYDPSVLQQLGAVTIAADVAQAREWYEKAAKFGSTAAAQRLATLAQPTR